MQSDQSCNQSFTSKACVQVSSRGPTMELSNCGGAGAFDRPHDKQRGELSTPNLRGTVDFRFTTRTSEPLPGGLLGGRKAIKAMPPGLLVRADANQSSDLSIGHSIAGLGLPRIVTQFRSQTYPIACVMRLSMYAYYPMTKYKEALHGPQG